MTGFFEAFRRMFAADKVSRSLGQIATGVINDVFIPELRKELAKARTDQEREEISKLISQYERASESSAYSDIAERVVEGAVGAYRLGPSEEDELAQVVALDFYQPLREGGKDLMTDLVKHDVKRGPIEFGKYWGRILKYRLLMRLRDLGRRHPDMFKKKEDRDFNEGGHSSPFDKMKSEGLNPAEEAEKMDEPSDEAYQDKIRKQMEGYMSSKTSRDPVLHDMYKLWQKVADEKGADYLFGQRKVKEELFAPLQSMYEVSNSTLNEKVQELRRLFKKFFEDVLHMRLTDAQLRAMHLASHEVIAYEEYSRRIAAWVLGVEIPR